jgi:hypothetical protein
MNDQRFSPRQFRDELVPSVLKQTLDEGNAVIVGLRYRPLYVEGTLWQGVPVFWQALKAVEANEHGILVRVDRISGVNSELDVGYPVGFLDLLRDAVGPQSFPRTDLSLSNWCFRTE